METTDSSSGPKRLIGQTIKRAIIYGTIATPIKKPDSDHTHRWTVYVRGFNDENISYYVRRVVFRLHESFAEPTRSIEKPPFEVSETGWGEFQIQIRIIFQDPAERPLQLAHNLRLYPIDESAGLVKTSKAVVSEHYDEIIFDEPTEAMASLLVANEALSEPTRSLRYGELVQAEAEEIGRLDEAIAQVKGEFEKLQQQYSQFTLK